MEATCLTGNGIHEKGTCLYKNRFSRVELRVVTGHNEYGEIRFAKFVNAGIDSQEFAFRGFEVVTPRSLLKWADGIMQTTEAEKAGLLLLAGIIAPTTRPDDAPPPPADRGE